MWVLNEDRALHKKLEGLTVRDANAPNGRPVEVRFVYPEAEMADITYPLVTIEHQGIFPDHDREHRAGSTPVRLPYVPEGHEGFPGDWYVQDYPLPYNIDYLVTVYSRFSNHDASLVAQMAMFDRVPARFGYLIVPEDNTVRRLDLHGGPWKVEGGFDQDDKRVMRTGYVVRISAELSIYQAQTVTDLVERVVMDIKPYVQNYVAD